jgi:hypothetical protein
MNFEILDSEQNKLLIQVGDFSLPDMSHNSLGIDCVTISPRYDHGFGFSQLYRVVKDKNSEEIKNLCDRTDIENEINLLPKEVSDTWRVILTPTTKTNDEVSRVVTKDLMLKLFTVSQSDEIRSKKLLITHFGHLRKYHDKTIDGLLDGILDISYQSFINLMEIYIEIEDKFQVRFEKQISHKLEEVIFMRKLS